MPFSGHVQKEFDVRFKTCTPESRPQMKIDRLIGILSILLQKEMTTAPELADHFEVSRRTINRDSLLDQ